MKYLCALLSFVAYAAASDSLVDVANSNNGSTLVSLLNTANLQGVLTDPSQGPFTVLVPVNGAFDKLPVDELNAIKSDTNQLTNVLQYHVIKGDLFSFDLQSGLVVKSLNGHAVRVYNSRGNLYFNQAKVIGVEHLTSNGVVYFIDEVLNVPEGTILQILKNPDYNTSEFVNLVGAAHLDTLLNRTSGQRYTVFVPSNTALATLDPQTLSALESNRYQALRLVEYHIHSGTLHAASLHDGRLSTLYRGHYINIDGDYKANNLKINNVAELLIEDIEAEDGVVHIISHVLIPSTLASVVG